LWHPTQILADLLTLHEHAHLFDSSLEALQFDKRKAAELPNLRPLTIAYVGDPANVLNDMLVTFPRLGHKMRIASPPAYQCAPPVWERVKELGCDKDIWWGNDPREAVHGADVVITDTW
jgi:ornithine carbamoyltransferase